jgi:hypothetical protein
MPHVVPTTNVYQFGEAFSNSIFLANQQTSNELLTYSNQHVLDTPLGS